VAHVLQVQLQSRQARRDHRVGCGFWWRVSKRGRWYAISKRRAFRTLMPGLMGELGYLEVTGRWPAN
jgi:hypothetical protein